MAGITHLTDIYRKKGKDFINKLFDNYVTVNEKIDGSAFAFEKNRMNNQLEFYKRDGRKPISIVDRTLARFYERPIKHFQNLSAKSLKDIPADWRFGFEYLPTNNHNEVEYDRLPKNSLILSYIHVKNSAGEIVRTIQDRDELNGWAKKLDVEQSPIIFQGELNQEQKDRIMEFMDTPFDQLSKRFSTESFVKYVISVLNPKMKKSFLNEDLSKPIEGVVFRFGRDESGFTLAKLIDPVFQALAKQKSVVPDKTSDIYHITILELMNFIDSLNLNKFKPKGKTFDERYLDFMCKVFNHLVDEDGERFEDMDYDEPEYLKRPEFDINTEYMNNLETVAHVERSDGLKKLFKILLATFKKKRRKPTGILTRDVLSQFNITVDNINNHIIGNMKLAENEIPLFGEFVITRGRTDDEYEEEDEDEGEEFDVEDFASRVASSAAAPDVEEPKKKSSKNKPKKVNMIVGRFQPFHNGHMKMIQEMYDTNKRPCVVVVVHPGHNNSGDSPLSLSTVRTMLNNIKEDSPEMICDVRFIGRGFLGDIVEALRPEYEPIIWAAGYDRASNYQKQVELNYKRNNELKLSEKFSIMETKRTMSGKEVRDAIRLDHYGSFKSKVPKSVQSAYTLMRKDIMKYESDANKD